MKVQDFQLKDFNINTNLVNLISNFKRVYFLNMLNVVFNITEKHYDYSTLHMYEIVYHDIFRKFRNNINLENVILTETLKSRQGNFSHFPP